MLTATPDQLVADLARDQVARIAPQELPLFRYISQEYFRDPDQALGARTGRDEMLSFGIEIAASFLTPIILSVLSQVVRFLAEQVMKSVEAESSSLIDAYVKRMFKAFRAGDQDEGLPPPLTLLQLAEVRTVVLDRCRALHLADDQAALLADSIVGSLVVAA